MKLLHTADWHLRPDRPSCRLDADWESRMKNFLLQLVSLAETYKAKLLVVGDIFDTSQMPPWVVNLLLSIVGDAIIFAGNHDFKYRNLGNIESSSIGHILKNPRYTSCIPEKEDGFFQLQKDIMLCHRLVLQPENSELIKFKTGIGVEELIELALEENPDTKWILTGDNHHHFHYESDEGIHVVNPGSPIVFNAKMIGETCGCYLIDTVKNTVDFIEVVDDKRLLTDEYLRKAEQHTIGLRAIVEKMDSITSDGEDKSGDFFERCDKKSLEMDKDFQNMYEDVKTEVLTTKRKGA